LAGYETSTEVIADESPHTIRCTKQAQVTKELDDNNNLLLSPNSLVIITHSMQLNNHNRI